MEVELLLARSTSKSVLIVCKAERVRYTEPRGSTQSSHHISIKEPHCTCLAHRYAKRARRPPNPRPAALIALILPAPVDAVAEAEAEADDAEAEADAEADEETLEDTTVTRISELYMITGSYRI